MSGNTMSAPLSESASSGNGPLFMPTVKQRTLDEAQRMYEVKADIFHHMPTAPVFDGVFDIMCKIKEAGMSICIVTGSGQRPLLERLVDDFGQFIDEQHIVSAYDVERGKPEMKQKAYHCAWRFLVDLGEGVGQSPFISSGQIFRNVLVPGAPWR